MYIMDGAGEAEWTSDMQKVQERIRDREKVRKEGGERGEKTGW